MLSAKKARRKRYRCKKKLIHRFGEEKYESILEDRLKKRWQSTQMIYDLNCVLEEEQKRKKEAAKELAQKEKTEQRESKKQAKLSAVHRIEDLYEEQKCQLSPLLLDEVVVPLREKCVSPLTQVDYSCQVKEAREERDRALNLAKHYRDIAEGCRRETLKVQYELETKVETVKQFWRNKIIEGESRSGRILRASLLKE